MNRRETLAAFGATIGVLAGCVSDEPTDDRDGTDDDRRDDDANPSSENSDDGAVVDRFETEASRPECETEPKTVEVARGDETHDRETAEPVPYPDPPTAFTEHDVVEYVDAFEHAYVTHDAICDWGPTGYVLEVGYDVETSETFDWDDDLTVVFLIRAGGATSGVDGDGYEWAAELGYSGVVYAVDETGAARADFDDVHALAEDEWESRAPDPLEEGSLVSTFE